MSSNVDAILEVGNVLVGYVQGVTDFAKNPTGADQASTLLTLAGVLSSAVGSADSPFVKALAGATGLNVSALSIVTAGIQLSESRTALQNAIAGGNAQLIAAARRDVLDKTMGVYSAVGGTMAAVPIPQVKAAGLLIWFSSTAAQQIYNGNAEAALNYMGSQIAALLKSVIGGPSIEFGQYSRNGADFVTMEFKDAYGITQGEFGKLTGRASEVWASMGDGWIVTRTEADGTKSTYFTDDSKSIIGSKTVSDSAWQSALSEAQSEVALGNSGISTAPGTTIDYMIDVLHDAGFDTFNFLSTVPFSGPIAEIIDITEWFSHIGDIQWYTDKYPDPDAEADRRLNRFEILVFSNFGEYANYLWNKRELRDAVKDGVASPIVIDMNGDGVQTRGLFTSQIYFDLTGDGVAERVGWIDKTDAFLAYDNNGNGTIDGVGELFGGTEYGVGYAKLAEFDSNGNGLIEATDEKFGLLSLWQDKNADGVSTADELQGLNSAGLAALSLNYAMSGFVQNGNTFGETSSAIWSDGRTTSMTDVYFKYGGTARTPSTTHASQLTP